MLHVLTKKQNPTAEELRWYMERYTSEDAALHASIREGLPLSPLGSLGPHSVDAIRRICDEVRPVSILEIGFNVGYSACLWLSLSKAKVLSVDVSTRSHTLQAVEVVSGRYPDRFRFLGCDSAVAAPMLQSESFDFAFVDGDHSADGVAKDLELVRSLGIRRIAMDDYWKMFSAAQDVLPKSAYDVVWQDGNIVLCELR